MGIVVKTSCKQVESFICNGCGNAHMWHDCMYQGHALVATLVAK
jgi:hypothetical protein